MTMKMKQPPNLLLTAVSLLLLMLQTAIAANSHARSIIIANESSRRVEVHWVDPVSGEMVIQSEPDILDGASLNLDSYVGHTFEVRELPAKKTGVCAGEEQTCRVDHFTVSSNNDQVIIIKDGIKVDHTDSKTIASNSAKSLLSTCRSTVQKQLDNNPDLLSIPTILDSFSDCVEQGIVNEIEKANEEITFQASVRTEMGELLEDYACADEKLNTTEPIRTESWRDKKVGIMIERPSFKIHTIENFVTHEECMAVSEMAEPLLEDAEVADGSGGGQISENRKAKQAAIAVDWEKEAEGDLIAQLSRRVYDYVNHALPFEIKENGQEELMSIQYFGRGRDDDQPRDQYMPHCDEDCTGMAFRPGTRMATIVMYCEVPTVGGATNFRNAMVHIKPTKHAATFFSYIDPVTMMTDSGFTEHSGCPVIEGNKKIVTQWVRLGVDDETPWDSFNTLGVKISDAENQ
ncbi:hypothetical protein ACHAWU_004544 [Discostella pseudostelligera]|uniref:Fe2OG dioxygenase domain-containing protein n=1 Tax=Discostella pseudostelligera TaxID=259834 RepID=A0ABD3MYL8_9STRA